MTDEEKLRAYAQEVYLTRFGRYIDDIEDEEGQEEVAKTITWTNLLLDELENEADWQYVRENDRELGTVAAPAQVFDLPEGTRKLVVSEYRPLIIMHDGAIVSVWDVVDPNSLTERKPYELRQNRVATVNNRVVFSRPLDETEIGGTVHADVINYFPRLASDDTTLFDLPVPRQILVLGSAKNAILPDIVQGGLTPSFVQKYADILERAKEENDASAVANQSIWEDYSHITGVY